MISQRRTTSPPRLSHKMIKSSSLFNIIISIIITQNASERAAESFSSHQQTHKHTTKRCFWGSNKKKDGVRICYQYHLWCQLFIRIWCDNEISSAFMCCRARIFAFCSYARSASLRALPLCVCVCMCVYPE